MLEKIDFLSQDVANLIIYTNSAILQNVLKKKIKEKFQIERNLTKYADTSATLKAVKNETFTPPFGGGTWLVDVQADKISVSDLAKQLNQVSIAAKNVYWVTNYSQYKKLCELEVVKRQGVYCFQMYTGKLYPEDITYLHNLMLKPEQRLSKQVLDYLKKNYTYDVDSVCKVFHARSQGEEFQTTKDIINKVGMGGNTIDSFVMKLLTTNPKTEKGVKKSFENMVVLLNDLSYSYDYRSIRNFIKNSINTIIEIKQLQIMGKYTVSVKNIPEEQFHADKIQRMRRFERVILEDINLARILNLKLCIDKYNTFNAELGLLEAISEYLGVLCSNNQKNPNSVEMSVKRKRRKI